MTWWIRKIKLPKMVYNDEKEQIRRAVFLPMYYTIISLMVGNLKSNRCSNFTKYHKNEEWSYCPQHDFFGFPYLKSALFGQFWNQLAHQIYFVLKNGSTPSKYSNLTSHFDRYLCHCGQLGVSTLNLSDTEPCSHIMKLENKLLLVKMSNYY